MQRPGVPPQLRRSMSIDMPRLPNKPQMGNSIGLAQHFPPQGIPVQQHNIMGQAFIELCHRAPEGRPRLPFNSSSPNVMNIVPQHQQHTSFVPRQGCQGSRHLEPVRRNPQSLNNPPHISTGLENVPLSQQDAGNPNHQPVLIMCHPPVNNTFSGSPLSSSVPAEATSGLQIPSQPTDGLEEKLDPDDPSVKDLDVKDLDGVVVKDLVDEDLENLNLDSEDGKGDELDTLDNLETNDGHLDYLLRSGEFDIIAYTDPDHDLSDKKGMFNEELDLHVPIDDIQSKAEDPQLKHQDDKAANPAGSVSPQKKSAVISEIKIEVLSPNTLEEAKSDNENSGGNVATASTQASAELELNDGETKSVRSGSGNLPGRTSTSQETTVSSPGTIQDSSSVPAQSIASSCNVSGSTPVLTGLLANESSENSSSRSLGSPPHSLETAQTNPVSTIPQTLLAPVGQTIENTLAPGMVQQISHSFSQGTAVNPGFIPGQQTNHNFGAGQPGNQTVPIVNRPGPSGVPGAPQIMVPQMLAQQQNRERPLLLEEQPLLLQDLLDQERQEQQQQRQMQAMIRQRSEPFFPNIGMFCFSTFKAY